MVAQEKAAPGPDGRGEKAGLCSGIDTLDCRTRLIPIGYGIVVVVAPPTNVEIAGHRGSSSTLG